MGMAWDRHDYVPLVQTRIFYWYEFGFYDNYDFRLLDTRWPRQQIIGHSLPGTRERVWRPPELALIEFGYK